MSAYFYNIPGKKKVKGMEKILQRVAEFMSNSSNGSFYNWQFTTTELNAKEFFLVANFLLIQN